MKYLFIRGGHLHLPPSHRGPCCRDPQSHDPRSRDDPIRREPYERWNELRQHVPRGQYIAHHSDHRTGNQKTPDPCLRMISDERSHLVVPGVHDLTTHIYIHRAVVVLEIAVRRQCTEIHPFSEIAVSQKARVVLIAVPVYDALLHLATDPTHRPDRAALSEVRTHNLGVPTHAGWAFDAAVREHRNALFQDDRSLRRIQHNQRLDLHTLRDVHI